MKIYDPYKFISYNVSEISNWKTNTSRVNAIAGLKILCCFALLAGIFYGIYTINWEN